ncbi:MAG: hypothetical protein ACK4RN_11185 [Pseudorhodobacter sp.]
MPLPLAPIALYAIKGGAIAATLWAARRGLRALAHRGRTDQRAEEALDALDEGLAHHRPRDRAEDGQSNAAGRLRRTIRWGAGPGQAVEIDAAFLARLRLRRL